MPSLTRETITRLLIEGGSDAAEQLLPLVYEELRSLAASHMRRERAAHTLQPTALVHEACIRLLGDDQSFEGRGQFFFLASRVMRNVLIDHARARGREKRGGGQQPVALAVEPAGHAGPPIDLLALDEALAKLEAIDERKARLIELRFFGGLPEQDAADLLGIARSTASEEARLARAWLARELADA